MRLHRRRGMGRWPAMGAALAALALALTLAACSTDSSSKLNLGLAGSTADHPSQPPALAANGPADAYAFVYDNQIWLHDQGKPDAHQLTHLVLSRGAAISWGPLVWSGSGRYIAFALVENLNPAQPSRTSGPIYYVDTQNGSVINTAATGSIYGHTYDWYGDTMLFYSTSGGIMMYGVINTGSDDPRVWPAITQFNQQDGADGRNVNNGGVTFGDIAVTNNYLYYTRIVLDNGAAPPTTAGPVGQAALRRTYIGDLATLPTSGAVNPFDVNNFFPLGHGAQGVLNLGVAYASASGDIVAGAWAVTGDESQVAAQNIKGVDVKNGTVSDTFCTVDSGCGGLLQGAGSFPFTARPNLAISPNGDRVAFTSDTLYVANSGGGGDGKLANAGASAPAAWSTDAKRVAVTQVTGTSTDASGVPRPQTNIVLLDGGNSIVLVPGGQNLSWRPKS